MAKKDPPKSDVERLRALGVALAGADLDDSDEPSDTIDPSAKALAAEIRAKVAAAVEKRRLAKHAAMRASFEKAEADLAAWPDEPLRPREEALPILFSLIEKAGPGAVSIHFHAYEEATPEDLARIIGELRYLIAKKDGGSS